MGCRHSNTANKAGVTNKLPSSTPNPNCDEFDYLVIGAGSGGVGSGRFAAATYGTKVCIIENRVIGGTCVNVGCVPKKVMFNLASFLEDAHLVMPHYSVDGTS